MTIEQILEIVEKYKLRMPPTAFYELKADIVNFEEPTTKNDSPRYCDRNICLKNEYNNVGCEDCEVTKSQESTTKNDLGVDLISRADVLKLMQDNWHAHNGDWAMQESMDDIRALPSVTPQEPKIVPIAEIKCDKDKLKELVNKAVLTVTPQEPKCKDCKWWKDSDGEYRRGCGAESQCPINRREVFEGIGYCYMFEPEESEDKE